MKYFKYAVTSIMFLALALVFIGCAQPPEAEKSAAKAAMDAAVAAGADKFATADFNAAKNLWETSEAKMNEKKYEEAKQGYVNAKAAFEKAAGAAAAGKKTITDEVNTAMTRSRFFRAPLNTRQALFTVMQPHRFALCYSNVSARADFFADAACVTFIIDPKILIH